MSSVKALVVSCCECRVSACCRHAYKHFYEHFTFGETDWSKRGKRLEKYVRVAIAIELVTVGTKLEDL